MPLEAVINAADAPDIYAVPLTLHEAGLDEAICRRLDLHPGPADLDVWRAMVARLAAATEKVTIGLVGKYIDLPDAYLSVVESLRHGALACDVALDLRWIPSDEVDGLLAASYLEGVDGIVVPGGLRGARHRGEDRRGALRPRERHPLPGPVPRPAVRRHRVRPPAAWASATPTPPSSTRPRCTRSST